MEMHTSSSKWITSFTQTAMAILFFSATAFNVSFGQCTSADQPVITVPPSGSYCEGDTITITWTGNLNDNTTWEVYEDNTGNSYFTTSNSIQLIADPWMELDIFGTGGCANGSLGFVEVYANQAYESSSGQVICLGDSALIHGNYESVTGVYVDSLQTVYGCDSIIIVELYVQEALPQSVSPSQTYLCDSGTVMIDMLSSEVDASYYLREDGTNTIVDGPFIGNGGALSFDPGMVYSTTNYHIYAEPASLAFGLDGVNDGAYYSDPVLWGNNNKTMECWFKWEGDTTTARPLILNGHNSQNGYNLKISTSGELYVLFGNAGYAFSGYTVTPGDWTHVAVTCSPTHDWKFYVNGVLLTTTNIAANNPQSFSLFMIGSEHPSGGKFDGIIDDVRMWNVERTAAEIQNNMNTCLTGNEPDLAAFYMFENGFIDETGNGYDLSPVNNGAISPWVPGKPHCSSCGNEVVDSITITVTTVNTGVSVSGITLTSDESGATYQWVDCNNGNAPIAGETNQSFTPSANGSYAVEVTINGCTETSACEDVTTVGMDEFSSTFANIYPNPNNGSFWIEVNDVTTDATVEVRNMMGQLVWTGSIIDDKQEVRLEQAEAGVYSVHLYTDKTSMIKQIVIR